MPTTTEAKDPLRALITEAMAASEKLKDIDLPLANRLVVAVAQLEAEQMLVKDRLLAGWTPPFPPLQPLPDTQRPDVLAQHICTLLLGSKMSLLRPIIGDPSIVMDDDARKVLQETLDMLEEVIPEVCLLTQILKGELGPVHEQQVQFRVSGPAALHGFLRDLVRQAEPLQGVVTLEEQRPSS